jgi:hypothetical protein
MGSTSGQSRQVTPDIILSVRAVQQHSPNTTSGSTMIWLLYIGGGLAALFALLLLVGVLHLMKSRRQAVAEIQRIELADIEPLAKECVDVFKKKLGIVLNPDDCEASAEKLDAALHDRAKIKDAFAKDGFYWYFVKPTGAYLGELLRRHAKHEWRKVQGQPPTMEVQLKGGSSEVSPFEKVIKQTSTGAPGDLIAYVELARHIEAAADWAEESED